jgi:hypothetical protein
MEQCITYLRDLVSNQEIPYDVRTHLLLSQSEHVPYQVIYAYIGSVWF